MASRVDDGFDSLTLTFRFDTASQRHKKKKWLVRVWTSPYGYRLDC